MVTHQAVPFFYGIVYLAMTQALMSEFEPSPMLLAVVITCHLVFAGVYFLVQKFSSIRPSRTVSFNHEVAHHVQSKRMDRAARTLNSMRKDGVVPNLHTYNSLLRGQFTSGGI